LSGRSFAQDLPGHLGRHALHPHLAEFLGLGHERPGRADGAVIDTLSALDLANPRATALHRGFSLVLGQWLELAALVRAGLLAGTLHQLDIAGLRHRHQGIGIQASDRLERSIHDGLGRLDLVDLPFSLSQSSLNRGVIGLGQGVAHRCTGRVEVHVGHAGQDRVLLQQGLALETALPEFPFTSVFPVGAPGNQLIECLHELLKGACPEIHRHIWNDKAEGGDLYIHLRHGQKRRRKRYGSNDSRGRMAGKRCISERPAEIETRETTGHWEIDTVMGKGSRDCILTLVERASGYTQIGKLPDRTTRSLNKRARYLIQKDPEAFETITADNGTEFHQFSELEETTGVLFYFARPYHSWERGTSENTNGLIRQYLPKGTSMKNLTQRQRTMIANILNDRPRKRLGFMTPAEVRHGV